MANQPKPSRTRKQAAAIPPPANEEPDPLTLELLNSEVAGILARQGDTGQRVDTKAGVLAGFAIAAIQVQIARHAPHPALAVVAVALYIASVCFAISSLRLREHSDLEPRQIAESLSHSSRAVALTKLVTTRVVVYEMNENAIKRKSKLWICSLMLLLAGAAMSGLAMVQTGSHGGQSEPSHRGATAASTPASERSRAGSSH